MASFAKGALLCAALGGTVVRSARVSVNLTEDLTENLTENLTTQGDFPVPLVGMSPEEIHNKYGGTLWPNLQTDLIYLRRIRRADSERFTGKFKYASAGEYVKARKLKLGSIKAVEGIFAVVGFEVDVGEASGNIHAILSWAMAAGGWANWLEEGKKQILKDGEDAPMRYIRDAKMGNLWEAMVNVNADQLVVAPPEESRSESRDRIKLFEREGGFTGKTLKAGTVVTPLVRNETSMAKDAILVSYEDPEEGLRSGWVFPEDVVPSLYRTLTSVLVFSGASVDAPIVHEMQKEELFAVTRVERDGDGTEWMKLSDGRGYVQKSSKAIEGPVDPECKEEGEEDEAPEGNKVLKHGWRTTSSTTTKCARVAFNVGMFVGGFFTGGATWAISGVANAAMLGSDTVLEQAAMSDLDVKLEYLLTKTRAWELELATQAAECHLIEKPCPEKYRCIRELAFHETVRGEDGYGRCMVVDLPAHPDGEACRIHADCESANCVPSNASCAGIGCVDTTCQPFAG